MEQNNNNKVPSEKTYSDSDILEQIKQEDERRKKQENEHDEAVLFALSPFAFAHAIQAADTFWEFLLYSVSFYLVCTPVLWIFGEAYQLVLNSETKRERIFKRICAYVISALVTLWLLDRIGAIK